MKVSISIVLAAAYIVAVRTQERKTKPPFVVDAVGNTLPPPSNGPATVGSPVNLISPDRYEFYTFDESGELVKRLMTLEEIQTIVAAGDEADGLVTFANENQPTVTFNFSQPAYNKVHSVVTNVQNVLKAQMEAHKKKPQIKPTLDTPDVSDSWSLILPSIFGNTGGVDIVPDKNPTTSFTTPETETFDAETSVNMGSLSKEGSNHLSNPTTTEQEELKFIPVSETLSTTTEATSITSKPNTTVANTTITNKPITTSTTTTTIITAPKSSTTTSKPTTKNVTFATEKTTTFTEKALTTTQVVKTTTNKPLVTAQDVSTTEKASFITEHPKKPTEKPTTTQKATTTKAPTSIKATISTTNYVNRSTTKSPTNISTTKKYVSIKSTTKPPGTSTTLNASETTTERSGLTSTSFKPRPTVGQVVTRLPTTSKPRFTTIFSTQTFKTTPTLSSYKIGSTQTTKFQYKPTSYESVTKEENQNTVKYDKITTYLPISTVSYVTQRLSEKTTEKPTQTTKSEFVSSTIPSIIKSTSQPPKVTTYKPNYSASSQMYSTLTHGDNIEVEETINTTTVTTQSVSPSTTTSTTTSQKDTFYFEDKNETLSPIPPMFDVALSISQIASDLGNNYQPIPTTSDLLDTTKITPSYLESKENFEIDITDGEQNTESITKTTDDKVTDNFIKISTIDPHTTTKEIISEALNSSTGFQNNITTSASTNKEIISSLSDSQGTTIDPILSESVDDLISQVVNQAPQVFEKNKNNEKQEEITTTTKISKITGIHSSTTKPEITTFNSHIIEPEKLNITTAASIIGENKTDEDLTEKPTESTTTLTTSKPAIETVTTDSTTESIKIKENQKSTTSIAPELIPNKTVEVTEKYVKIPYISTVDSNIIPTELSIISTSEKEDQKLIEIKSTTVKYQEASITTENSLKVVEKKESNITFKSESSTTESNGISAKPQMNTINRLNNYKNESVVSLEDAPKEDFKKKFQKVNIDDKELANERNNSWKLISTVSPPKTNEVGKDKIKQDNKNNDDKNMLLDFSSENQGLEVTTKDLSEDIAQFTELCNELAFRYWNAMVQNIDKKRSFVLSPFSITSMLAMMFMGARGSTSGEMNEILKLDDMVTFNPHFTLKNISDSIETSPESGVIVSAFIRELYSDKSKGKVLTFYKERAQHFYNGHVEEVNFKLISDVIRRRTNLLVKRYTWSRMAEYMKYNDIVMQPPLAAFSANIFLTDCRQSSVEGRDGEMYFVVSPSVRQRRLVPVPAVLYRAGFLAGYDPALDATAAAIGTTHSIITTLFLMPGQQGNVVHADDLEALEKRLLDSNPTTPTFNRILRTLLPRVGLELQIPRFSHKSIFNISSTLKKMGLKDLFDAEHADLGGLIGPSKDLFLSDMVQQTTFVTCGEGVIAEQHHIEEYPESLELAKRRRTSRWTEDWDEPRDYQRAFHDPHDLGEAMNLPLHLRPRQARLPAREAQPARLKFDRPFLYFVRHNPTGMILYVGRYNPRLLP